MIDIYLHVLLSLCCRKRGSYYFCNFDKQYEVSLSQILKNIRSSTSNSDFPTDQTVHQFYNIDTGRVTRGFHETFATGEE